MRLRPFATYCCTALFCHIALPAMAATAAAPQGDALTAIVATLGRINGQALACGQMTVVKRAKDIVIDRVPKTRELGATFESATQQAFLAQGSSQSACPARTALAVELETVARPLAPALTHKLTESGTAPETGINPRYLLQAVNGHPLTDGDFRDRFQLITFGYTFCPDVCPTTLLEMAEILKQLGAQAARLQPLFFSVDPERDTLEQLRTYTSFFDPRIVAATGSPELVRRAADNFKVRYEKVVEPGANPANYAMDHTAGLYLLAPGGQFLARFPYGTPVSDIVTRLQQEFALRSPPPPGPTQ